MLETVEALNRRLLETYGRLEDKPKYRIAFSDDEFEVRMTKFTDEGFEMLNPLAKRLPKYLYIKGKHILEILMLVPEGTDLLARTSYEPLFVFQDKDQKPLPPKWEAIEIIIYNVMKNAAAAVGVKYKDPAIEEADPKIGLEVKRARLDRIKEELFGNETDTTDALAYKQGVVVPNNYGSNTIQLTDKDN